MSQFPTFKSTCIFDYNEKWCCQEWCVNQNWAPHNKNWHSSCLSVKLGCLSLLCLCRDRGNVFVYCIYPSLFSIYIFFCHLTGGWHGKSDQDQRERPMGGRVQGQARPLSFHPRSTVGTTPPRWRELRNTRTPITSTVSSTSLLLRSFCHARKEKKIYSSTQLMNLWAKPVRHSWLRQCKTCWVILPNVLLMSLH